MATPKEDCERFVDPLLSFADHMLTEYGEFFPFGATMSEDGEIAMVAGSTGEEAPASSEVMSLLEDGFRAGARDGKFKAAALVYCVRLIPPNQTDKTDAIALRLDHRGGYSAVVYFPYKTEGGAVQITAPFAVAGAGSVFGNG